MCVYICLFGLLANVGAWGYDNDKSVHYNITFFGKLVKVTVFIIKLIILNPF